MTCVSGLFAVDSTCADDSRPIILSLALTKIKLSTGVTMVKWHLFAVDRTYNLFN